MRVIACLIGVVFSLPAFAWQLAEAPEEPGDWGYRPVTEQESINPPGFSWAPEEGALHYHLQVSRFASFKRLCYEFNVSPWTSHAPSEVLPRGITLYWRYRAYRKADGWSDWSQARQFSIAKEAPELPKPSARQVMKRIPKEHPRLFLRPETLGDIEERLDGDLAPLWAKALRDAEGVLKNPPDTTEPPLYPEGTERGGEQWKKIWWGNRLHGIDVMSAAAKCAFAYRLNGDERCGKMAHDLMMAFARWDPRGATQYDYNDEAAMPLLYWPARTYTWAWDTFTAEERRKIVEVMRIRGKDCFNHLYKSLHLWRPYNSHSNRAWHKLAELSVAFYTEIPEAPQWLDYALTKFFTCYPVWGGADGGWHEGIAYWQSYMDRFIYWAVTMRTTLGVDAFEKPFFRDTGDFAMYTMPPGAKAGAWGDQAQGLQSTDVNKFMGLLAAQSGRGDWQWYAEEGGFELSSYGWFGLVIATLLPEAPKAQPPVDKPSSKVFPETGLAVLNSSLIDGTKNVQVHFKSSAWGRQSHGYNSNNAFMLYVNGDPLLTLTGKRDVYGSPHHTNWMWESKSDNAVLINGQGQRPHSSRATGSITRYELSPELDVVEGDAGASFIDQPTRWTRRLFFFKPGLLLIHDILNAPQPSTFQWLLHSNAEFTIAPQSATTTHDGATAATEFLYPQNLTIIQTGQFDPPPYEWAKFKLHQWHLRAETTEPQPEAQFLTAIHINGDASPVEATQEANSFHIAVQCIGKSYTLTSGPDGPYEVQKDKR